MPSRKVYVQENQPTELTIHLTPNGDLYVELQDPDDAYTFQNILLSPEDARDIVLELNQQLKSIDEPPQK